MVEVEKLHGWLPRIIHQTYADRDIPSLYRKNIDNFLKRCQTSVCKNFFSLWASDPFLGRFHVRRFELKSSM